VGEIARWPRMRDDRSGQSIDKTICTSRPMTRPAIRSLSLNAHLLSEPDICLYLSPLVLIFGSLGTNGIYSEMGSITPVVL
jgi:hypothetical protein